jgi:hypothetical protein
VKRDTVTNTTNPIKNLPVLVKQVNLALLQSKKKTSKAKYIVKDSQGYYIM